jgi:FdhE protein
MTSNMTLTSGQIKTAVEAAKKSRPAYRDMLDFYGRIFDAQVDSERRIRIDLLQIPAEMLSVKARENFPLIDIKEFVYDENEASSLFLMLCRIAKNANPKLAAAAEVLLTVVEKKLPLKTLFSGLLAGDEALFENIMLEFEIDKRALGFITYNSIKPSLSVCAEQLAAYLSKNEPWPKGYCPICGSSPILSMLEGEGARSLVCGFCWHKWSAKRIFCPFCEKRDNAGHKYFYSEDENEFRVEVCDNCKKYLKTIDARKADRLIYPPLEQVSTLHLDLKAKEMGFESGIRLFMQV